MTNEKILKKAIEKAVKNGWHEGEHLLRCYLGHKDTQYKIIFSHDFAKAFWGEKTIKIYNFFSGGGKDECMIAWEYHLTKMVLEKEPLKYLERFL